MNTDKHTSYCIWVLEEPFINHDDPSRIPLIRPYFLAVAAFGWVPLDSYDTVDMISFQ